MTWVFLAALLVICAYQLTTRVGVGLKPDSSEALSNIRAARASSRRAMSGRARESDASEHHVCFVIRTYQGHGPRGSGSLQRMLDWLHASPHKRCVR